MKNDPDELGPKHLTDEILIENKIEPDEDGLNTRIEILRFQFLIIAPLKSRKTRFFNKKIQQAEKC